MIRKCRVVTGFKRSSSSYVAGDIVYLVLESYDDELGIEDSRWGMLNVDYENYYYKDGKFDHPIETIADFDTVDEAINHVQTNAPKDPEISLKQASIQNLLASASAETKQASSTDIVNAAKDFKLEAAKMTANALSYSIQAKRYVENIKKLYSLKAKELARELALKAKNMSEEIEQKMKDTGTMLAKAEEALWTVNLYLGVNQQTTVIRDGVHAPADVKLHLRQRVLAMDEEAAEEFYSMPDSIDCENLHKFDKWLLDNPAAVQKLIPEQKGIVGLCIRKSFKEYKDSDSYTAAQKNEKNLRTSFLLIKNGDALYRIYADIHFGGKMFPTPDDFEKNLSKRIYDKERNRWTSEPLDPKSKEFADAMEKANGNTKHYMRILLVLQGLFDRTEVFRPFKGDHINICSYVDFDEHITLIDDANANKLLEEDKLPYNTWLAKVNSALDVGHRICGYFNGVSRYSRNREDNQIYPPSAEAPSNDNIYLLTKTDYAKEPKFFFTYDRIEENYYEASWGSQRRREGYKYEKRRPKAKARCTVERSDWFIIDVDNCEIADIQYYLRSRKERNNNRYNQMIPVMQKVLKIRLEEQQDEKPFRTLLVAEIAKKYKVNPEKVEKEIDQLIKWWKLKNKTHRALLSDDSKAYRMIISEYKQLLKRQDTSINHDAIETIKKELKKEALLIAKKGQHDIYVTYEICHPWSSVLVDEKEWTVDAGIASLAKDKKETVVDNRHIRWLISYESPKWADWPRNANYYKLVTQDHIDEIDRQLRERSKYPDSIVVYEDGMHASAWYVEISGKIKFDRNKNPLCQSLSEPQIKKADAHNIGRNNNGITCTLSKYPSTYVSRRNEGVCAIKYDTKIFDKMMKIYKKNQAELVAAQKAITNRYSYIIDHIIHIAKEQAMIARRTRFDTEYGGIWNEDLWNEWIKNRPVHSMNRRDDEFTTLRNFLNMASLRNIDIVGMKLNHFIKKMIKLFRIKNNNPTEEMHRNSECKHCIRLDKILKMVDGDSRFASCSRFEKDCAKLLKKVQDLDITIPPAPETPEEDD